MHVGGGCHVITTTGFAPNVIFIEKKGINLLVHLELYIYTLLTADYPQLGSQGGRWGQSKLPKNQIKH